LPDDSPVWEFSPAPKTLASPCEQVPCVKCRHREPERGMFAYRVNNDGARCFLCAKCFETTHAAPVLPSTAQPRYGFAAIGALMRVRNVE